MFPKKQIIFNYQAKQQYYIYTFFNPVCRCIILFKFTGGHRDTLLIILNQLKFLIEINHINKLNACLKNGMVIIIRKKVFD